jgi:hypothetical protein
VAALMGGTLAATSHVAKATTRAAINTSPEPFSNIGLSLAGDAVVPAMLWLAWAHPLDVQEDPDCQPRRDRLPRRRHRAPPGRPHRGGVLRRRRQARHVRACDEAVHIGGAAPRDSYLRGERILAAAQATGAQAVHPGYGFLSENEASPACADAGIVFIGPPPRRSPRWAARAAAKALMERPACRWCRATTASDNDPALAAREAARIGYPVLIKASAGGGGKGMRASRRPRTSTPRSLVPARGKSSFGDDHVLVERYVTRPRHIEIQVFGDATAGASTCSSATARCSAATRRCWRRRPRPA